MTRPFFSRERVTDLDRFERHTQTALSLLVEKAKTGYAMDIQDVMQRLALDVSTDILFGSCANTLEISAEDLALPYNHPQYSAASAKPANRATAFSDAFLNAQFVIADRERHGHIWPLLEIFEDRAKPHMEVVNRYVDPIIQEALRKNADNPKSGDSNEIEADETLLDHLVRSTSGVFNFCAATAPQITRNRSQAASRRDAEHPTSGTRHGAVHFLTSCSQG